MTRRSFGWLLPACLVLGACAPYKGTPGRPDASVIIPREASVDGSNTEPDGQIISCDAPKYISLTTQKEGTHLRVGWTGLGHATPMPDGETFSLEVFDCDSDCRTCRLSGPVNLPDATYSEQRCADNPAVVCTQNSDCGGNGRCRFFLNAATEISFSGLMLCARLAFEPPTAPLKNGSRMDSSPIQGTVDLTSGGFRFGQFGLLIQQGGCRVCAGDGVAGDNIKGGTCDFTLGQPCDRTNVGETSKQGYSYDCDWGVPLGKVGEFKLDVATRSGAAATSQREWELSDQSPNCGSGAGDKCFCGHCANAAPCHVTTDCTDGSSCVANPGERANACDDGMGFLFFNPVDCPASGPNYDPVAGTSKCTVQTDNVSFEIPNTPCFADNGEKGAVIRASGTPDPFDANGVAHPVLAALTCAPATGQPDLNKTTGFPGPTAVELQFEAQLIYEPAP